MPDFFKTKRQKAPNSHDYALLIVFTLGTFAQLLLPVNGFVRCGLTLAWAGILINAAMKYRARHQWQWQGASKANVLKSMYGLLIGFCTYVLFVIHAVNHMEVDITEWSPSVPTEYFTQTIRLFAELLVSTDRIVNFLLVPVGCGIFMALVNLKIAYLYEEAFLKDCQQGNDMDQNECRKPRSISSASASRILISRFFSTRPLVLSKRANTVRITFYKISAQDISKNIVAAGFSCFVFLFSIVGVVNVFRFGLLDSIQDDSVLPEARSILLGAGIIQCGVFVVMAVMVWLLFVSHLFAVRTIDFGAKKLVMRESVLGFSRRLLRIHVDDLRPLVEKPRNTKIPEVRNTALLIFQRGKQVELAGQLLPEAMDIVQTTYDTYRTSDFYQFYDETQPICVE